MNIKKLKINICNIAYINPITNKKINRGYRAEIAYKASQTDYIDYVLDNKINLAFGDYRQHNYIYQVKSCKCEIKLVKSLHIICNTLEDILYNYVKYNKANRYVYIIEYNGSTYAITMNNSEFIEFVKKFGTYSNKRQNIRISKSDKIIYESLFA
jgi:hypothetical protein